MWLKILIYRYKIFVSNLDILPTYLSRIDTFNGKSTTYTIILISINILGDEYICICETSLGFSEVVYPDLEPELGPEHVLAGELAPLRDVLQRRVRQQPRRREVQVARHARGPRLEGHT